MSTFVPVEDASAWMDQGLALLLGAMDSLDDTSQDQPTALPGWTRRHVLAHVASNAEALQRLASWARTGEENPMYASAQQRDDEIDRGATLPPDELRDWVRTSAARLGADLGSLPEQAWRAQVVTAQGRTVPATELPWMRAREVAVHAVDLDAGVTFADLPTAFCAELIGDVAGRRSSVGDGPALHLRAADSDRTWTVAGTGDPAAVSGTVDALARWLTGRGTEGIRTDDAPTPTLPRWL